MSGNFQIYIELYTDIQIGAFLFAEEIWLFPIYVKYFILRVFKCF